MAVISRVQSSSAVHLRYGFGACLGCRFYVWRGFLGCAFGDAQIITTRGKLLIDLMRNRGSKLSNDAPRSLLSASCCTRGARAHQPTTALGAPLLRRPIC